MVAGDVQRLTLTETIESIGRPTADTPMPDLTPDPKESEIGMSMHDCLIDPCPICAVEHRLDFPTDRPWKGDHRELKKVMEHFKILRGESSPDIERSPAASLTRERTRPNLLAALRATRLVVPYRPPTRSDYLCY
jgi:hypothetical protein